MALEWQVDTSSSHSTETEPVSEELEAQEPLNSRDFIQTLRGLQLVEVFSFATVEPHQVKAIHNDFREIARQSSAPYEISRSQSQQLRKIFSSLSEQELTAVNQLLLIQQAKDSLSLTSEERQVLREALQEIPNSNLTPSQREQLREIRSSLSRLSEQNTASVGEIEALQSAIAQVFFTSETRSNQATNQTEEREGFLVTNNPNYQQNLAPSNATTSNSEIAQSSPQNNPNNSNQEQYQRQRFRSNLATHLTNSNPESSEILLSTLTDQGISQENAETLINSIENMFQEVDGGEIFFRVEMAKRIQTAQTTFNEVLQELDTEILETPPDSLLIIRDVIAEVVEATRPIEEAGIVEETDPPETPDEAASQSREDLISQLLIADPETEDITIVEDRAVPALGLNVPSGFGTEWGQVFAGIGYQASTRPVPPSTEPNDDDGAFAVGMGFGDPQEAVGLEAVYTSFGTFRSGPFSTGSFSFKLHRRLSDTSSAAVGVENLIQYGGADGFTSYYGSVTNIFNLTEDPTDAFSRLAVTAGLGSGRFRQFQDAVDGKDRINVFGSVGLQVAEPVSLLATYTGQTLTLGASVAPFRDIPLVITPSVTDITGDFIDSPRFVITVGYGDRLFNKD
ncbi:MAG: hypothetical protein ACOC0N_00345 [Chroococcales cyanobacterium]